MSAERWDRGSKICLDSISKQFGYGAGQVVHALDQINLEFLESQFVCIIGPSGCGKSTLLNIVAGLIQPTAGRILVSGQEVHGPGRDRGMVFQQDACFLWRRVRSNIEYGLEIRGMPRSERRAISDKFLNLVGLTEFADAYPKELSGGMKKRVAIAMVLANEPEVMLMDEPFGSLDYPTKVGLQKALLQIWMTTKRTTLFVTHDLEEALFLADRLIVLDSGSVVDDIAVNFSRPRVDELRTSPEFQSMKNSVWDYIAADAEA